MNPKKVRHCLAGSLLLFILPLSGCTQWRYDLGTHLTSADRPDVEQGVSLTQVLAQLGPPQRLSALSNGYVLAWEHWQVDENTFGLSLGAMGADFLSLDMGKAHIRGEFLLLTFNRHHQLTSSTFSHWSGEAGGGQGIQPLLSLVSTVDVDDLVERLPHHRWGATLLKPMPETLNTGSHPDTGQTGIQQRGTPTGAGQQSLEMNFR